MWTILCRAVGCLVRMTLSAFEFLYKYNMIWPLLNVKLIAFPIILLVSVDHCKQEDRDVYVMCGNIYSAAVFIWLCEVEVQVEKHKAPSMRGEGVSEEMDLVQQKPPYLYQKKHTFTHLLTGLDMHIWLQKCKGEYWWRTVPFYCCCYLPHSFCWHSVKHMCQVNTVWIIKHGFTALPCLN